MELFNHELVEAHQDRALDHHWRPTRELLDAVGLGPLKTLDRYDRSYASILTSAGIADEAGQWLSYSRRHTWYATDGRYRGTDFTYATVTAGVQRAVEAGLLYEQRALPGDHERTGLQSRIRATPKLVALVADAPRLGIHRLDPEAMLRMRDCDKKLVAFPDNERARRLRREIVDLNAARRGIEIDVASERVVKSRHSWTILGGKGQQVLKPTSAEVYRVFGRGRLDRHGRAYGWWQSLPKDVRKRLLINNEFCIEEDFAAHHPSLLYALCGVAMAGSPYEGIKGVSRDDAKAAMVCLIGASSFQEAAGALMGKGKMDKEKWPHSWGATVRIVEAVAEHNAPIRHLLGRDIGISLMSLDSMIAMDLMKTCAKAEIPVLPVHDSFIAPDKHQGRLIEIMDGSRTKILVKNSAVARMTYAVSVPQMLSNSVALPALAEKRAKKAGKKPGSKTNLETPEARQDRRGCAKPSKSEKTDPERLHRRRGSGNRGAKPGGASGPPQIVQDQQGAGVDVIACAPGRSRRKTPLTPEELALRQARAMKEVRRHFRIRASRFIRLDPEQQAELRRSEYKRDRTLPIIDLDSIALDVTARSIWLRHTGQDLSRTLFENAVPLPGRSSSKPAGGG